QFRQACAILRTTSRASNPAWYQEALELNLQLHIRVDGARISTFYHDRKNAQWSSGPELTDEALQDPARLESIADEALRFARSEGATSLGVILHIADEFATTELKPELDNPAALADLRDAAIQDPGSILADSSIQVDQSSWRVIPYPASGGETIGSTITLSKQYAPLIAAMRTAGETGNFPIITHALSAPMVAMMGLNRVITPTPGKPFVTILQYPWFTALAFFNEHADLRLIRTLQHRGLRRPTNFRNALATTNASLEFIDPDLFLCRLGANVDTTLDADLRVTFTSSRIEVIKQKLVEGIPSWCPEPFIASLPLAGISPTVTSHTFSILGEEKWALQNFLPTPKEVIEVFPSRSEMRLLTVLRLARVAVFAIAIMCVAYFVFGVGGLIRREEWSFDPSQADVTKGRLGKLNIERQKVDHWNNLLDDRSKAWVNMEAFSRMFPETGGMLVNTYTHSAKPENAPGQAKVGLIKEWKIAGYARDEALDYLNTINTREGISAHFSEIARITGNSSFNPNIGNRNLVVNVRTQENSSFKPVPFEEAAITDTSTYPFTFDLTITQRFEATDPLAVTVSKAP
ncbi:MAG: hypothetical protein ACRDBP_12935, partial [Luteolibacter sp.]